MQTEFEESCDISVVQQLNELYRVPFLSTLDGHRTLLHPRCQKSPTFSKEINSPSHQSQRNGCPGTKEAGSEDGPPGHKDIRKKFETVGIHGGDQLSVELPKVMEHVRSLRDRFVRAVGRLVESALAVQNHFRGVESSTWLQSSRFVY